MNPTHAVFLIFVSTCCWAAHPNQSPKDTSPRVYPQEVISNNGASITNLSALNVSSNKGTSSSGIQCASIPDMSNPMAPLPTDSILGNSSRQALRGCPTVIEYAVGQAIATARGGGSGNGACAVIYITNNQEVDV